MYKIHPNCILEKFILYYIGFISIQKKSFGLSTGCPHNLLPNLGSLRGVLRIKPGQVWTKLHRCQQFLHYFYISRQQVGTSQLISRYLHGIRWEATCYNCPSSLVLGKEVPRILHALFALPGAPALLGCLRKHLSWECELETPALSILDGARRRVSPCSHVLRWSL